MFFFCWLLYPIVCIVLFFQIYHILQAQSMPHEVVLFYTFSIVWREKKISSVMFCYEFFSFSSSAQNQCGHKVYIHTRCWIASILLMMVILSTTFQYKNNLSAKLSRSFQRIQHTIYVYIDTKICFINENNNTKFIYAVEIVHENVFVCDCLFIFLSFLLLLFFIARML